MARRQVSFIISARNQGFIKALEQSQRRLKRFGYKVERMGRTLTRNITVPVGIAGGAAIKMASDFEASMSKIEGLVGLSRQEIQGMRGDVLRLAGETSRAPQELADALFFVTSAGLRGADAIAVLEASARAAAAGLGETKVVADLVTSAVNAYGIENLSAAEATDILVAAVREGKAEAPDLAASLGQVLPVASEMGVTFNQVGAAVAAMTRTGTDAQTAATQLRQILFKLLKPAAESEQAFRKMGTSGAELRKQLREKGLISVLGFLREQMKTNEQAMAQAFPRVQALAGALDLMGSNAEENIKIFERMTDTTGSADKAFNAAAQTTQFKFNKALSNLRSVAIKFGNDMLPVANKVLKFVNISLDAFGSMSTESRKKMLKVAALFAASGPVLLAAGKFILVLNSMLGVVRKVFTAMVAVVSSAMGRIAIAFLAGIMIGQRFVDNMTAIFTGNFQDFSLSISGFVDSGIKGIKSMLSPMMDLADKGFGALSEGIAEFTGTKGALEEFYKFFNESAEKAGTAAQKTKEKVDELKVSLSNISIGTIGSVSAPKVEAGAQFGMDTAVADVSTGGLQRAESKFNSIAEAMKGVTEQAKIMGDALQSTVTGAVTSFAETLGNAFTGDAGASGFFNNIILIVVDFAKQLGRMLVAAGIAAKAFKQLLFNPVGAIIAGGALIAAATAVRNLLTEGPSQSVDDALIKSDGSVIRLHPDDDVLAMKDFGNLSPAASGSQVIKNIMMLDGQTVWENQRRVNTRKRR